MKKIFLIIFCCLIATFMHTQVIDEIEAIQHSSFDSATQARYEHSFLVRQKEPRTRDSKTHINTKSAIMLTTVSKTLTETTGGLKSALSSELITVTDLTVRGTIDARDFITMRDDMNSLSVADFSEVTIATNTGTEGTYCTNSTTYPANTLWCKNRILFALGML